MNNSILFSRRPTSQKVDFAPSTEALSPSEQSRRLSVYLASDKPHVIDANQDITDCPQALDALREYSYRKLFTGTSHADFVELDERDPQHVDWMLKIHEIVTETFNSRRNK